MKVKFIHHPKNDLIPPLSQGTVGESVVYELLEPFNTNPNSKFWLRCFKCGIAGHLGDHDEVKIENGLVTISPSIECPIETCKTHYFIKNGEIQF